jgi:hypothetical protein
MNVKMKIIEAAAAPYCDAFDGSELLIANLDIPPARNMAMPWPTDPQYNVHLRPIRSRVNTQMSVENYDMISMKIQWGLVLLLYHIEYVV